MNAPHPPWCHVDHANDDRPDHVRMTGALLDPTGCVTVELEQLAEDRPPTVVVSVFHDHERGCSAYLTAAEARAVQAALETALDLLRPDRRVACS